MVGEPNVMLPLSPRCSPQLWEIMGSMDRGGLLVREACDLSSPKLAQRLACGALVQEMTSVGDRLQYKLLYGIGPQRGWITTVLNDRTLARRVEDSAIFDGNWVDNEGAYVTIKDGKVEGVAGGSFMLEIWGGGRCFCMGVEGQVTEGGTLVWDDATIWLRQDAGALVFAGHSSPVKDSGTGGMFPGPHREEPVPGINCQSETRGQEVLPARAANGRRPLPEFRLTPSQVLEWILDAVDEFEVLMLPLQALEVKQVRQQYKQLLLLVHPDKNDNPRSNEAFRMLFTAFGALADPTSQRSALQRAKQRKGFANGKQRMQPEQPTWWDQARDARWGMWQQWITILAQPNVDEQERVLFEHCAEMERRGVLDMEKVWPAEGASIIEPVEAKRLVDEDAAIFADARDYGAYMESHIPDALECFAQQVWWGFGNAIDAILSEPEKMVVVYSDNGSSLSRCVAVAKALRADPRICSSGIGAPRILRLKRGLNCWKRNGFPVNGSKHAYFGGSLLGTHVTKLQAEAPGGDHSVHHLREPSV